MKITTAKDQIPLVVELLEELEHTTETFTRKVRPAVKQLVELFPPAEELPDEAAMELSRLKLLGLIGSRIKPDEYHMGMLVKLFKFYAIRAINKLNKIEQEERELVELFRVAGMPIDLEEE